MKIEFAIQNGYGQTLALSRDGEGFVIIASDLMHPNPGAVQLWTRAELVAIRNQINKALNTRA